MCTSVQVYKCREGGRALFAAVLCIAAQGSHIAAAAQLPKSTATFHYTVLTESVGAALQQFGHDLNLRINVSDAVDGRIESRLSADDAPQFLDTISSRYGLDWYYDGYAVFVSANAEAVSRTMPIPSVGFEFFHNALMKAGVLDTRYPVQPVPGGNEMRVSGPPRYVALVERTAHAMAVLSSVVPDVAYTTVFRGSGSQTINFSGKEKKF